MKQQKSQFFAIFLSITAGLVLFVILPLSVRAYVVQSFHVTSRTMADTILFGDYFLCDKTTYFNQTPSRGDIVVFPYPEDTSISYVMRVIGLGEEQIEIVNKKVYIDDTPLSELYALISSTKILSGSPRDNMDKITIPDGHLFVMGDNRDITSDSRFWGFVNSEDVICKATQIYWSKDPKSKNIRWDRIGKDVH